MSVSSGLQQHFDKKAKKRDISSKLDDLRGQIDPAFLASFENFRTQVLSIVDEAPEETDVIEEEIGELETKLQRVNKKRSIKTFEIITEQI